METPPAPSQTRALDYGITTANPALSTTITLLIVLAAMAAIGCRAAEGLPAPKFFKVPARADVLPAPDPYGIRQDIGATTDQWTTLEPLIQRIQELQWELSETSAAGMLFPPNRPQPVFPFFPPPPTIDSAIFSLRSEVFKDNSSPAEIQSAISTVRRSRDAVRKDLATVQGKLRKAVNPRQEAILISDGILE